MLSAEGVGSVELSLLASTGTDKCERESKNAGKKHGHGHGTGVELP